MGQHSGLVVSPVASQQTSLGFYLRFGIGVFLCYVAMFSLCLLCLPDFLQVRDVQKPTCSSCIQTQASL